MNLMKAFLQKIHPVPEAILDEYLSHWKPVSFKRKELITREGETERYMYFVLEGIQRSYHLQDGKEHVMAFTYPPSFSGIPESFIQQKPSRLFLECITASNLLRIPHTNHQAQLQKHRELETLFRIGTEFLLIGVLERHYELLAFDIEARFKIFAQRSPHLFNMVPHKHLASYLRIDPTNFSKLLGSVHF